MTKDEKDELVRRLEAEQEKFMLTKDSCLPCLVGQRDPFEMIWCDNCPKQVCVGHANPETLAGWDVGRESMLCPACKPFTTVR